MTQGIQRIYAEIAPAYERANRILTLGLDRRWRRDAVARAARILATTSTAALGSDPVPGRRPPHRVLDACSGTGEMAEGLRATIRGATEIVLADFSLQMLTIARGKPSLAGATFTVSDAARLPFPDATFDAITLGFAARNLDSNRERLLRHLREFHRVLRPGGFFLNLETSQPRSRVWRWLFHLYVALAVRPVGRWISGSRGYAYLAHTIPRFHSAAELTALLHEADFGRVEETRWLRGIAAMHVARRQAQPSGPMQHPRGRIRIHKNPEVLAWFSCRETRCERRGP